MRDKETKLVKAVHDQKTKVMKAAPRQKRGRFSLSSLGKKKWGAIPPSWKGMPSDRPLYDQETKIIKAIRPSKSRPTKKVSISLYLI